MRILIVNHRFWPASTGSERWLAAIGGRLAADGHAVTVATTDGLDDDFAVNPATRRISPPHDRHADIEIKRFALAHLPGSPFTYRAVRYGLLPLLAATPAPERWLRAMARRTAASPDLLRWLATSSDRYDLVLSANVASDGIALAAADAATRWRARLAFVPFTHLGAGPTPGSDGVGRHYTLRHQRALARRADVLLAMTEAERAYYLTAGLAEAGVHVVGAGIEDDGLLPGDADAFRVTTGVSGPIVAYLAPLHPNKGIVQVVDAVDRVLRLGQPLTLVAAGTPYPAGADRVAVLGAQHPGRVVVLRNLSESEKRDLLAAADALVMPSRTDSFGIVFLEAWAQGRPVVGSTAWGMRDVIAEGVDGLLAPFGDSTALVEALLRLLQDPALRARLGDAGRRKVLDRYRWDSVYQRVRRALGL